MAVDLSNLLVKLPAQIAGDCTGHAVTLAVSRLLGYTPSIAFARWNGQVEAGHNPRDDDSVGVPYVLQGIDKYGLCSEPLYPYTRGHIADRKVFGITITRASAPPVIAYSEALNHRIAKYEKLDARSSDGTLYDPAQMMAVLDNGRVFPVGVIAYNGLEVKDGALTVPDRSQSPVYFGAHALCIAGYKVERGKVSLLAVNSWGSKWGPFKNATVWLSEEFWRWPGFFYDAFSIWG